MSRSSTSDIRHSALADSRGAPLVEAELSDRQRLGVLLQASALLYHLDLAGRVLAGGWKGGHVDHDGVLCGLVARAGGASGLPQQQLSSLARLLFGAEERIAGRGEARRIVRQLMADWQQRLKPLPPEETVQQILELGRFLWLPSFAAARESLAAEHLEDGSSRLWVAGPEWFRNSLLRECRTLAALTRRLRGEDAESLWRGRGKSIQVLVERGRWREVVAAWRARPRTKPDERVDFAAALIAVGRYSEALEELRGMRRAPARALRVRCLTRLGELNRAKREVVTLEAQDLAGESLLEAASAAIRLYGNLGLEAQAASWAERAISEAANEPERGRALLLAFAASWDRGDRKAMRQNLEDSEDFCRVASLRWRWRKARALEAIDRGDGAAAVSELVAAFAAGRRRMTPVDAGDLWNEVAVARSLVGDLHGAERALGHTIRLHREAEGPRKTTLALFNLAEVRLRRGRLEGVREILEQSTRENRKAGNWRGMAHDVELWARYELVRGRPSAAQERLESALTELGAQGVPWRRGQLNVLLARALGWLERPEEAAEVLASVNEDDVADLEPEERPALWALAGDRERALGSIVPAPAAAVWKALLTGGQPTEDDWKAAAALGSYRLARLVFDVERLFAESAPGSLVQRAAARLRRAGAGALAEQLAGTEAGAWQALAHYLERGSPDPDGARRLLAEAGYGEAELIFRHGDGEDVIVEGVGGRAELAVPMGADELVVRTSWIDSVVRAMLGVLARDLEPRLSTPAGTATRSRGRFGIVGESGALVEAMNRLDQLAPEGVPVLLVGETGTGKELAARRIHRLSSRAEGPFIPLNCAAVSEELLMSDLFGHVRGAYTGAVRDRMGVFEAARGGTVFLDEIGDLPLRAQGFLLRVLQEGEVRRVGESLARATDVRVVTATHRDLEAMVREGNFRADLYYRLRVAKIEIPPLRDRGEDLMLLADHFLERMRPHAPPTLTPESRAVLLGHGWPGNVRELENVLSVAVAVAGDGVALEPEHLDLPYRGAPATRGYHELVLNYRRRLIRDALAESGGRQAEAARRLGLTRQALSYLVRKLGIEA